MLIVLTLKEMAYLFFKKQAHECCILLSGHLNVICLVKCSFIIYIYLSLRKIIWASKLEFILFNFLIENYGALLLTSFRKNSHVINSILTFVCTFKKCT